MKDFSKNLEDAPILNTGGLSRDMGTVMIVAPHPDDETLGCGALIAHLRAQQAEVWVLFMTSGEASHPNSSAYPPEKLGKLRKNEAVNACKILGVSKDHLIFLDAGDGQLASYSEANNPVVAQLTGIIQQKNIDTLFVPWRRDHHIDHVATNSIIGKAAEDMKLIIAEYPIWLWKKGKPEDWPAEGEILPFRLVTDSVKQKKRKAIEAHVSQTTKLIDDDPEGFTLSPELLEPFLGDYEYFFFPSEAKPAVNISYFDDLYSNDDDPWDFETSPYEQKKYNKTLDAIPERNFKNALEIGCANGVFTALFAPQCKRLLALDLNRNAVESARKRCSHLPQCHFMKWDVANGLPSSDFDIIILSEVAYYFEEEKLQVLFANINDALAPGGILVMVHWTAYVRSYPLTGLQVHEVFAKDYSNLFRLINSERQELYDLVVWEKQ
ncbi:bifunctional PIG-L family deacetylase/class I SAM-dependent methyltransferase [Autumnicola musiva]|uniref:Bifunctional PIG-L family deacetylase/class I SAM-dependent methyltransferase n=1 Tax=Autumnicola musiva TaxID=3075589 RepID=A0ABU3D942_9FLAO|nr:bifunctional PIG-L family deacetylase/class I SAM-dependent methyltransferase [Zunongwangia sp. F117]MDT0677523.1 bifunctional PIG-L family deacetylase/class I SAM-dependent methyltransferase [Zunongwangia sp. F117]